ncbi:hypothetical protein ACFE04_028644 [Oxalis oulophora]
MAESENNKNASVHEPGNQSEGDDLEWYSDNLEENSDYDLSEGSVDLNELIDVNIDKEDENSKGPQIEWQEDQEATNEIDDEEKEYNSDELNNILTSDDVKRKNGTNDKDTTSDSMPISKSSATNQPRECVVRWMPNGRSQTPCEPFMNMFNDQHNING